MATSFINLTVNSIGTLEQVIFTAAEKSVVIGCNITSLLSTTVPITVKIRKSGSDTYFYKDKRLSAGEFLELFKGNKLVLQTGDQIVASAKIDNSIDIVLSVLQGVT